MWIELNLKRWLARLSALILIFCSPGENVARSDSASLNFYVIDQNGNSADYHISRLSPYWTPKKDMAPHFAGLKATNLYTDRYSFTVVPEDTKKFHELSGEIFIAGPGQYWKPLRAVMRDLAGEVRRVSPLTGVVTPAPTSHPAWVSLVDSITGQSVDQALIQPDGTFQFHSYPGGGFVIVVSTATSVLASQYVVLEAHGSKAILIHSTNRG